MGHPLPVSPHPWRLQTGRGASGQRAEDLLRRIADVQGPAVRDTVRSVVLLGDLPAARAEPG